jgi:virulence-associated protein VapD
MSFRLENTEKYLRQYTESLLDNTVVEIARKDRTRNYPSRPVTTNITASGSLQESLKLKEKKGKSILELNIEGNSYAEEIDEGTSSTEVSKDKLIQWIKNKRGFKDLQGKTLNLTDTNKISSIAKIISKSLKLKGIYPTRFLSNLVESKFKELKNINQPITLDIEEDIDNVLKKLGYKKTNNTFTIETKTISNVNNN